MLFSALVLGPKVVKLFVAGINCLDLTVAANRVEPLRNKGHLPMCSSPCTLLSWVCWVSLWFPPPSSLVL